MIITTKLDATTERIDAIRERVETLGLRTCLARHSHRTAGVASGADGVMVEVHARPETARSDGEQALTPAAFSELMSGLHAFACAAGRTLPAVQIPSREAA